MHATTGGGDGRAGMAEDRDDDLAEMIVEARDLGQRWIDDDCGFCDVTLGVARSARRLRALERPWHGPIVGRALLSPMPDDQHGFGLAVLALRMREAGWDVTADLPATADALVAAVRRDAYDLIGLSVGHDRALARVGSLVRALRTGSRQGGARIALGGPMLNGRAALAFELGADLHADTAEEFVQLIAPAQQKAA